MALFRASNRPTYKTNALQSERHSLCYCEFLTIQLICLMSVLIPLCACDTQTGFVVPKFESLKNFSYKSPGDLNGTPVKISADTLLLTPDPISTVVPHQLHYVGRIVYRQALQFIPSDSSSKEVSSFASSLTFSIQTTSSYGRCGDGLAIFITSDFEPPPNSTGRYLGLQSEFEGSIGSPTTALSSRFFDDPSASHIGIDINSLNSSAFLDTSGNNTCCRNLTNSDEDPGQCSFCKVLNGGNKSGASSQYNNNNFIKSSYPELFLYNNYTFTAWIEYDARTNLIQLWMTNRSTNERPAKPCLGMKYNLSEIFLPQMYVGISAATGNNFEGITIYSWNFTIHGRTKPKGSRHKRVLITICIMVMAIIIGGAVCICLVITRSRKRSIKKFKNGKSLEQAPHIQMESITVPRYSYKSLRRAAHSFDERWRVGQGGFSSVYKGFLEDGQQVAIKKLKDGVRMEAEFASEVQIISQIRHRNLLQLQGWCYEKGQALLVYQFMPNGSLDSHLFGSRRDSHSLDSETRFKVLIGVAAALEYLHTGLGGCVLHRDVKAANVLLSDKFEAMLGDFGLARLITHDQVVTMTAAGTPGYVAPEVIYTGKATDKADVYGFGVLALEVACGRRELDPSIQDRLSNWVWSLHQSDSIMKAVDPSLGFDFSCSTSQSCEKEKEQIEASIHARTMEKVTLEFKWRCILHLGLLCCHLCPDARPTMRQVHQVLEESTLLPLPTSRPVYAPSYDLSSLTSSVVSLSYSCPLISEQSINSPYDG